MRDSFFHSLDLSSIYPCTGLPVNINENRTVTGNINFPTFTTTSVQMPQGDLLQTPDSVNENTGFVLTLNNLDMKSGIISICAGSAATTNCFGYTLTPGNHSFTVTPAQIQYKKTMELLLTVTNSDDIVSAGKKIRVYRTVSRFKIIKIIN